MKNKNEKTRGHTPGPWNRGYGNFVYKGEKCAPGQRLIAVCEATDKSRKDWDEVFANAALIAAAPELLERLEAVQTALEEYMGKAGRDENAIFNAATYAVIAKAKGEKI